MSDIPIPVSYTAFNTTEIRANAAITEALFYKVGEQINKLIVDIGTAQSDITTIESKVDTTVLSNTSTTGRIVAGNKFAEINYTVSSYANPVSLYITEGDIRNFSVGTVNVHLRRDTAIIHEYAVTITDTSTFSFSKNYMDLWVDFPPAPGLYNYNLYVESGAGLSDLNIVTAVTLKAWEN